VSGARSMSRSICPKAVGEAAVLEQFSKQADRRRTDSGGDLKPRLPHVVILAGQYLLEERQ
jgi:hypothetical protein